MSPHASDTAPVVKRLAPPKDFMLRIRVETAELERWREAAKRDGYDSLSAWLRDAARRAVKGRKK